jgi:hypothetical protein
MLKCVGRTRFIYQGLFYNMGFLYEGQMQFIDVSRENIRKVHKLREIFFL